MKLFFFSSSIEASTTVPGDHPHDIPFHKALGQGRVLHRSQMATLYPFSTSRAM
jgi:hypothetical protein